MIITTALLATTLTLAGQPVAPAASPATSAPAAQPTQARAYTAADGTRYTVQTVASKLEVPWAMAFTPDGSCIFTERRGRIRIISPDGTLAQKPLLTLSNVTRGGEIGLMGVCTHPDFATNQRVYFAYGDSTAKDIRVVHATLKGDELINITPVVTGIETGGNHAGCGVKFGPDGKLYISTGEHFKRELSQQMNTLNGKILRVNDDGSVPADNPFVDSTQPGVRKEIWTLGNRNPQGFDWHPTTRLMYSTEHGPSGEPVNDGKPVGGADEFNLIEKGLNYGWPAIYGDKSAQGMLAPLKSWTPGIAPCGGAFVTSNKMFDKWVGNYMVAGLGGLQGNPIPGLYMVSLASDGRSVAAIDRLVPDMGRIRAVAQAPDGSIWFSTSNKDGRGRNMGDKAADDQIVRLVPVR